METKEKVIKTMQEAGKPMKAAEIAEVSGVDKKEVDKVVKLLVAEGKVHSPKRCFYGLK